MKNSLFTCQLPVCENLINQKIFLTVKRVWASKDGVTCCREFTPSSDCCSDAEAPPFRSASYCYITSELTCDRTESVWLKVCFYTLLWRPEERDDVLSTVLFVERWVNSSMCIKWTMWTFINKYILEVFEKNTQLIIESLSNWVVPLSVSVLFDKVSLPPLD